MAKPAKLEKSPLAVALDHMMIAAKGPAHYAPYCHFQPGWIVGYDGIVAAGYAVTENLTVAPNTELFRHAVMRAGGAFGLTAMADGSLVVRGNKVRAIIPTFPLQSLPNVMPDAPLVPLANGLSVIVDVSKLAIARAETVIAGAVLLRNNTAVSTDGMTIVEGWHGSALPGRWVLPKEFCDAVAAVKTMPTHCGWGDKTFTVWFGDKAWLRTNVYDDKYPDTDVIFAQSRAICTDFRPVPEVMAQAVEMLKPFREGAFTHLTDYGLNVLPNSGGASYSYEHHLTYRGQYPTEGLKMLATHGLWVAFGQDRSYWYGNVIRGTTKLS